MTHCQIFYPFDNEDGYISVVCHRERFLENLLSLGWQKTAAEAIAVRDELTQHNPIPEHQNFMFDAAISGAEEGCGTIPDAEEREFVREGKAAGMRKKLSLKK